MNEWLRTFASVLGGGVLGFYISRWSAAFARRRAFRSQVGVWLAQLRDTPDGSLIRFHTDTKTVVRDECARIGSDVCCGRHTGLDEAAQQYYALTEEEIIKDELGKALRPHTGDYVPVTQEAEFPGRARMAGLLQKICDYAK